MGTTFPVKFTAAGLADVIKASQKVKQSYLDWLEAAEKAIAETNKAAEQFADDQEKLAKLEKERVRAAQNANRAVEASYRELGVKSTRSIEEAKNRAISAYEALKKSGVASSRDLEVASKRLEQRLESLDNELKDVSQTAGNAGSQFTVLKGALSGFLSQLGTQAFFKITNALQNFAGGIISTRTELSKLRDQLELLEGSEAKGELVFARLSKFAETTPFELKELVEAYTKLANRGVKPTTEQLTKLGDVALSQGKSLGQLVEAVLDVRNNERFTEFGIKAQSAGDQVTLSFKGASKTIKATEKDVLAAVAAFGELDGIQGNIEKAANRLDGVGSNIADTFTRIKDAIGGALEPLLVEAGKGLVEFLAPLSDPLIWAPLQDALKELFAVFTSVGPEAEELRAAVVEGLTVAIQTISVLILDIAETLKNNPALIEQSIEAVKTLITVIGVVVTTLALVIDGIVKITGFFTTAAVVFRDTLGAAIAEYPQAWSNALGGIQALWDGFIGEIIARWQALFDAVRAFFDFALGGFGEMQTKGVGAVGAILEKANLLPAPFRTVFDIGTKILGAIAGWTSPIERALKPLREFQGLLDKILGKAVDVGEDTGKKLENNRGGPLIMAAPGGAFSPDRFPVTSRFGMRGGRMHYGTDYGTPEGTPLANIFGTGVVTLAGNVGGYGNLIELTLGNGDVYRFGHLSQILVRQGQVVPAGALMGLTGNTGRSSGPHLHLEYYPGGGPAVDFEGLSARFGSGVNVLGAAAGRGGPFTSGVAGLTKGATAAGAKPISDLKATVEELDRLRNLAGLESAILTGQAVAGSQYDRDRLTIERKIVETQADLARQLAQLRVQRAEAENADQIEYVDTLIDKYAELNKVELTNLTNELTKLDDANAEALRLSKQTLPALEDVADVVSGSLRELPDLLVGVLTGTQSLGQGILGFLGGIASRIGGLFLDKGFGQLDTLIGGLFSSKGGGGGGGLFSAGIGALFGGSTPKFAMGGVIPGYGGGDIYPAFLEPGEAVIRKEAVAALGRSTINNLNSKTYNNGGAITINYNIPNASATRPTRRQLTQDLTVATQRYGRF